MAFALPEDRVNLWLALAIAGATISGGIALLLFALWLERYTRNYGRVGGPPWEMRR